MRIRTVTFPLGLRPRTKIASDYSFGISDFLNKKYHTRNWVWYFCEEAIKKIFLFFCLGLNCSVPITPKACISSKRSFVYHQGESLVYHHCERKYSLRLMIYTFGDEIHAKAWWYTIAFAMDKKIRQVETCRIFWQGRKVSKVKTVDNCFYCRARSK